jgi:hypothetical protein
MAKKLNQELFDTALAIVEELYALWDRIGFNKEVQLNRHKLFIEKTTVG